MKTAVLSDPSGSPAFPHDLVELALTSDESSSQSSAEHPCSPATRAHLPPRGGAHRRGCRSRTEHANSAPEALRSTRLSERHNKRSKKPKAMVPAHRSSGRAHWLGLGRPPGGSRLCWLLRAQQHRGFSSARSARHSSRARRTVHGIPECLRSGECACSIAALELASQTLRHAPVSTLRRP